VSAAQRIGPGDRGFAAKIALLMRLDEAGHVRYLRMEQPNDVTGAPRLYVVEYAGRTVALTGQQVPVWVAGFEAGMAAQAGGV
jgi:hypothetical protein